MKGGLRKRFVAVFGAAILAAVLVLVFHDALLRAAGEYLVKEQPPEHADVALVLAGDGLGHRILRAAELARQEYAPLVLVSGPMGFYGHECDVAIPFAVKAGYPESYFLHFEHTSRSTREEAAAAAPVLRRLGAHTVLLVTSDYHTRRAGSIFRATTPDIRYVVIAAPAEFFSADGWWHNREGQKIALLEWTKTVANWFRL